MLPALASSATPIWLVCEPSTKTRCRIWSSAWAEPRTSSSAYLRGDLIDAVLIEEEGFDGAIGFHINGVSLRRQEVYQQSIVNAAAFSDFRSGDFLEDDDRVGIDPGADPVQWQAFAVFIGDGELLFHVAAQRCFAVRTAEVKLATVEICQQRGEIVPGVGVHDLGAAGALVVADVRHTHVEVMGRCGHAGRSQHGCYHRAQAACDHFFSSFFSGVLKSRIRLLRSRSDLNSSRRDCDTLRGHELLDVSMSAVSQYGSWVRPTIGSSVTISLVIFFGE